jgi:hypothetical protein
VTWSVARTRSRVVECSPSAAMTASNPAVISEAPSDSTARTTSPCCSSRVAVARYVTAPRVGQCGQEFAARDAAVVPELEKAFQRVLP